MALQNNLYLCAGYSMFQWSQNCLRWAKLQHLSGGLCSCGKIPLLQQRCANVLSQFHRRGLMFKHEWRKEVGELIHITKLQQSTPNAGNGSRHTLQCRLLFFLLEDIQMSLCMCHKVMSVSAIMSMAYFFCEPHRFMNV